MSADGSRRPTEGPIRVLQVIDHLYVGGAQSVLLALLTLIDRERFDVTVVNLSGSDEQLETAVASASRRVVHVDPRGLWDLQALFQLVRLVRELRIDVVHTHLTTATVLASAAARIAGRPSVASLHSVAGGPNLTGRTREQVAAAAMRRFPTRLLPVSEAVRDSHAHVLGVPPARFQVIANVPLAPLLLPEGFDPAAKRQELGVRGPLVSSVSRLTSGRDHITLVRAVPELLGRFPDVTVLLVGKGSEERALEAEIARLDLRSNVRLLGIRFDAAAIVASSHVVCQPTLHEGMPITVLDAMSLGVPVVVSDVEGMREIVDDGRTGILVPPRDSSALARGIGRLLENEQERHALGRAARQAIARRYDARRWIHTIEEVYLELAGSGRAGNAKGGGR